jgi:hypothetical protein
MKKYDLSDTVDVKVHRKRFVDGDPNEVHHLQSVEDAKVCMRVVVSWYPINLCSGQC